MRKFIWVFSAFFFAFAGCTYGGVMGNECLTKLDCTGNKVCYEGFCSECKEDADCDDEKKCVHGSGSDDVYKSCK